MRNRGMMGVATAKDGGWGCMGGIVFEVFKLVIFFCKKSIDKISKICFIGAIQKNYYKIIMANLSNSLT